MAGRMRLSTFLVVAGIGVTAVVGGGGYGLWSWMNAEEEPMAAAPMRLAEDGSGPSARELVDGIILDFVGKDLGVSKLQDVRPGGPKINLYQDEGFLSVNRAKVDLDRDEHDDEKWTLVDGTVTRTVSPRDDDQYTETWVRDGAVWVREGGGAAAPSGERSAATPAGRPVDGDLFSWQGKDLRSDKKKDVTAGKPYKINVYQDAGSAQMNRAKIDLDRDDKWDEKITFDGTKVTREAAPADDEVYTERYHWDGSSWVAAP